MNESLETINNENWHETLGGILWKLEQLRDENITLKNENLNLKEELNELKEKEV